MSNAIRAWGASVVVVASVACGGQSGPASDEGTPASAAPSGTANASAPTAPGNGGTNQPSSTTPPAGVDGGATASGCGGKSGASGDHDMTLMIGSTKRTARLHVPSSYDPSKAATLVVNFHGLYMDASGEIMLTKMNAASDQRGFVVVYPQGIDNSFNAGLCCGTATSQGVDDVAFARALVQSIQHDYCIDDHRIFATGMSNGGHMAYRLACDMADVVAAVAPVAGVLAMVESACKPSRPVPVMHFHGTADPIVAYSGTTMRGAPDSIRVFQEKYGCADAAGVTAYQKGDATCVTHPGCSADLELCTIDGGGHTWPGGNPLPFGKTSTDIDATNAMLDFFTQHPKP